MTRNEAEWLIEDTRISGGTVIDLSSMELDKLPDSLSNLTQLQEIDLSGNPLDKLPDWFRNLIELQALFRLT